MKNNKPGILQSDWSIASRHGRIHDIFLNPLIHLYWLLSICILYCTDTTTSEELIGKLDNIQVMIALNNEEKG